MTTQLYYMIMTAQQRSAELRRAAEQARLLNDAPGQRRKIRDAVTRSIRSGRGSARAALELESARGGVR